MAEQEDEEFAGMQDDAEPELAPEPERETAAETPGDRAAARAERAQPRERRTRAASATTRAPGALDRAGSFWRDVRAELKRVTWPTVKEVQHTTVITVIAVIFFAAYLWGVDRILAFTITQLESVANRLFG